MNENESKNLHIGQYLIWKINNQVCIIDRILEWGIIVQWNDKSWSSLEWDDLTDYDTLGK